MLATGEGVPFNPVPIRLLGALCVTQAAGQTKREVVMDNSADRTQPMDLLFESSRMVGQVAHHLAYTSRSAF